jgi:enoyl-CoA hydratase/carnithine racemase
MPEDIRIERHGEVEVVTIDRPQKRNALRWQTYDELETAFRTSTARCIVLTGTDPAFCSGDDVKEIMGSGTRDKPLVVEARLTPAAGAMLKTNVPIIAAVNGAAVGWGMEMAMMADIRVASDRAKFGELFVLRGLCTDVAGIGRLAQLVGRERAAELLYTGDVIDADTAAQIGLVSRVVAHEELLPTALALATKIAERPPLAVQKIKEGLRLAVDPDWDDLGRWVATSLSALFRTEDHREGVQSFLEKRPPVFTGR